MLVLFFLLVCSLYIYIYFELLYWVHYGTYKSSYNTSQLNSPPLPFSFILPSSHSWNSFNSYQFSTYIHVYKVFVPYSSSYTLPHFLPHFHCSQLSPPPGRTCSVLLFFDFVKEKRGHFCLFKIAKQWVFLWHLHVSTYYSPIWFKVVFWMGLTFFLIMIHLHIPPA
jgi:hypothetical protein